MLPQRQEATAELVKIHEWQMQSTQRTRAFQGKTSIISLTIDTTMGDDVLNKSEYNQCQTAEQRLGILGSARSSGWDKRARYTKNQGKASVAYTLQGKKTVSREPWTEDE